MDSPFRAEGRGAGVIMPLFLVLIWAQIRAEWHRKWHGCIASRFAAGLCSFIYGISRAAVLHSVRTNSPWSALLGIWYAIVCATHRQLQSLIHWLAIQYQGEGELQLTLEKCNITRGYLALISTLYPASSVMIWHFSNPFIRTICTAHCGSNTFPGY